MQAYNNIPSNSLDGTAQEQRARLAMYHQMARMNQIQAGYPNYGSLPMPSFNSVYDSNVSGMASLDQDFGALSVQGNNPLAMQAVPGSGSSRALNMVSAPGNSLPPYVVMHDGKMLLALPGYPQHEAYASPGQLSPGFSAGDQAQYQQLMADRINPGLGFPQLPVTPQPRPILPRVEVSSVDTPGLGDRKSSQASSTEREQSASPDTPVHVGTSQIDSNVVIARPDHSPQVNYDFRTPSPAYLLPYEQAVMNHTAGVQGISYGKGPLKVADLGIPPAITAVFDARVSRKTLEASLYNATGTTNVYIRGFSPETNDAMLLTYASRFGKVATSKAMIDNQTGACKGFGFACYHTYQEAENCIRGFYSLGYDVSFARESFNARLKALSDPNSTNLYVSNLPRSMTEAELAAIFIGYTVESSRIQRDDKGNSKGVGFARFKDREECDDVIAKFNGQLLGQERLPLQIRYADTQEQKRFKQVTQERRDYKSGEYNTVAYGGSPSFYRVPYGNFSGSQLSLPLHQPIIRRASEHWDAYRPLNPITPGLTGSSSGDVQKFKREESKGGKSYGG